MWDYGSIDTSPNMNFKSKKTYLTLLMHLISNISWMFVVGGSEKPKILALDCVILGWMGL